MALREIVKLGDDTLRKVCREQTKFDHRLHVLLDDMPTYSKSQNLRRMKQRKRFFLSC